MSLYNLKREYEERRQALVDQLQKNQNLDPATQHQIYGAIKEIENFLKTIEYQISSEQDKNISIDFAQPRAYAEQPKGAIYHLAHGTKKIFTHHIPKAVGKVVSAPKVYFDKRKEEARLKAELEQQKLRDAHARHLQQLEQSTQHLVLEHPHQELAMVKEDPAPQEVPFPTWSDDVPMKDDTVHRADDLPPSPPKVVVEHKRPKPIQRPSKEKVHPSKKAKSGHQKKPHKKADRYSRDSRSGRK